MAELLEFQKATAQNLLSNLIDVGDTINDPAFELGRMIAELSIASEKKDQYSIYRSLQQIHGVFNQLKITDRSLDSLLTQSEKVVLRKVDLQQKDGSHANGVGGYV